MFAFDKELFRSSSGMINESISQTNAVSSKVDEVVGLASGLEVDISGVKADITSIKNDLESLNGYITNTLTLLDELEANHEGGGNFEDWDDEDWEELLMPTSPFAIEVDGEYGAAQGGPYELFKAYLEYKENIKARESLSPGEASNLPFVPGLTETEEMQVETIIQLFNEKGIEDESVMLEVLEYTKGQACGHAVITNYVCELYTDDPEAFEEKYGYPLFVEKYGHMTYNYEAILTDVYLDSNDKFLSDNITEDGFVANNTDSSIHPDEMADKASHFLGVEVEAAIVPHDASTDTYKEYMDEGYEFAAIAAYRYDMNAHGENEYGDYIGNKETENGHWMTVTGVSENDKLLLSSWGSEYELEHTDYYAKFPVDGVQEEDRDDECLIFLKRK